MNKHIKNMLDNDFELEILKYFIKRPAISKYLHKYEVCSKHKDLIMRLNKNETLTKKEYVSLLCSIFINWPYAMSTLKIDYKNVISKLIIEILSNMFNICTQFNSNKNKNETIKISFTNDDNRKTFKQMEIFRNIIRSNTWQNIKNLNNNIFKSEIDKLSKKIKH